MCAFIYFVTAALVLLVSNLNAQLSLEYSDAKKGKVSKENPLKTGKSPKLTDAQKDCAKNPLKSKDGKLSGQSSHDLTLSFQGLTVSQLTSVIKDDLTEVVANTLSLGYCVLGSPTVTTSGSTVVITFTLTLSSVAFASLLASQINQAQVLATFKSKVQQSGIDPAFLDSVSITSFSVDSAPLTVTAPSAFPSLVPSAVPAAGPSTPTRDPTSTPSVIPTSIPTVNPTSTPLVIPTSTPSVDPTSTPSVDPTSTPSVNPTSTPSVNPTSDPTSTPSVDPTSTPSVNPTSTPSVNPTSTPSVNPTSTPSVNPTSTPSVNPTSTPSVNPTSTPLVNPTVAPSAPSPVPTEMPTEPTCFPQHATVVLADSKGVVKMADLQYGDRVKVVNRRGEVSFQEVIIMGHRIFDTQHPYVHLKTSHHELRLSDEHFARVCTKGCEGDDGVVTNGSHDFKYVMAKEVKVGDKLLVLNDGTGNQLYHETVIDTWMTLEEGVFAPIVDWADLVVDGVVVSPFAGWIVSHTFPWLTQYEPYFLDVLAYLFHLIYNVIGPKNMERVAVLVNFHEYKGSQYGIFADSITLLKVLIILGAPVLIVYLAYWLSRKAVFGRIKSKKE